MKGGNTDVLYDNDNDGFKHTLNTLFVSLLECLVGDFLDQPQLKPQLRIEKQPQV